MEGGQQWLKLKHNVNYAFMDLLLKIPGYSTAVKIFAKIVL